MYSSTDVIACCWHIIVQMWNVFALVVIFGTIRNIYDCAWGQDEAMATTTDVRTQVVEDTNTLFLNFGCLALLET